MFDVAIVPISTYSREEADAAMEAVLAPIGGLSWVKEGMCIVIKPNLAIAKSPDAAATTHPALLSALVRLLKNRGARIIIGESPGGLFSAGSIKKLYDATGMREVEESGAQLNMNFAVAQGKYPEGKVLHQLQYTQYLDEADAIISFGKLKTHGMMGLTGAAKNMFGCIPGTIKAEYHYLHPSHDHFADMLVDVCERFRPQFSLIDAVIGMEGNGPTAGTPRQMNALIASPNPHAADLACTRILGIAPSAVPTLVAAHERRLVPATPEELSIHGDLNAFALQDVQFLPRHDVTAIRRTTGVKRKIMEKALKRTPRLVAASCIGCGECKRICPADAITMKNNLPVINKKKCICCFCCQEFCPKGTIKVHRTWLVRMISD